MGGVLRLCPALPTGLRIPGSEKEDPLMSGFSSSAAIWLLLSCISPFCPRPPAQGDLLSHLKLMSAAICQPPLFLVRPRKKVKDGNHMSFPLTWRAGACGFCWWDLGPERQCQGSARSQPPCLAWPRRQRGQKREQLAGRRPAFAPPALIVSC